MLGFLIKKGKKTKAEKILKESFLFLSKNLKLPSYFILNKVCFLLNIFVEIKKLKIKGRWYSIPFPVNFKRRIYLVIKSVFIALQGNKQEKSFSNKLQQEIFSLCSGSKSSSYGQKVLNNKLALTSRSNIHYRW
jgi:small subunit ribosomal protein S7